MKRILAFRCRPLSRGGRPARVQALPWVGDRQSIRLSISLPGGIGSDVSLSSDVRGSSLLNLGLSAHWSTLPDTQTLLRGFRRGHPRAAAAPAHRAAALGGLSSAAS